VDEDALRMIVDAAELTEADTVVEVGPGLGVLTEELAKRAGRVIAIELDEKLAAALGERLLEQTNVEIVAANILDADLAELLGDAATSGYKVVANLPYYITSLVLRRFLETPLRPGTMVVMVQREVAETIAAQPGRMSLLSVSVQLYGAPEIVAIVPASSFHPPPSVDSAILKVTATTSQGLAVADEAGFFALVRAGFSASRKQLGNSLAQGLRRERDDVLPTLAKAGIDPKRRAQTLSVGEWRRLWEVYEGERC
jgi:16S rRNA (adenine1518-N6/adenine1519-N6)-dimethyltransferase